MRNRIEDLADPEAVHRGRRHVPKLTFDGQTTWLLVSRRRCRAARAGSIPHALDCDRLRANREIDGYRPVPDRLAGPEGLNICDEIRIVRRGFYLGRSYFGNAIRVELHAARSRGAGEPIAVDRYAGGLCNSASAC